MRRVVTIPQAGGTRYLALTEEDARRVDQDPAMVDAVRPLACLDDTGGRLTWERPLRGTDTEEGRAAIRAYRRDAQADR